MPAAPARCMAERTAISMASRSRCPVLRRPLKMTRSSWSTSRAISWRIASAVFFLWRLRLLLDWPQVANLSTHVDKLTAELLEFAKLGDLPFGLVDSGRVGERFRNGLALDLEGQAEIGAVARLG